MKHKKIVYKHYHYLIVAGCFFLTFSGLGIAINSMSVFLKPVIESLAFARGEFALSYTLITASTMIASPFAGKFLDKYSMRLVMTFSCATASVSIMLYSRCNALFQFYMCSVFLGLALAAIHLVPVSMLITSWFKEKRGLFLAIAMTGGGIGGMVLNPFTNWLIVSYGWRVSFAVLGCIFAVTSIPVALFIVKRLPSEMGLPAYGESVKGAPADLAVEANGLISPQAVKTPAFWLLGLVVFITGLTGMGVQMHIPAYLTDIGYSSEFAANIVSLFMGIAVIGKILAGSIFDRFGMKTGAAFMYLILTVAVLTMFGARIMPLAITFGIITGLAFPILAMVPALLTAGIFGQKDYGVIYGVITLFLNLGGSLGMPLSGFIFDNQGSYFLAWVLYAGLALACIPAAFLAIAKGKAALERFAPLYNH